MNIISENQITKHLSYDSKGYIFDWNGKIYRAIYASYEKDIMELFQCGLIDELTNNDLFPRTEITKYKTVDCNLVIQHDKISVHTLPSEWSFSMLKDAALTTISVNIIARKYNYQTLDAHGFNILFHRGAPIYIDIGSFVKIENEFFCTKFGWRPYGEFMRSFFAPLKMWSLRESYFARHALYGEQIPMTTFWRFRSRFLRMIPIKWLMKFDFIYYKYKSLNTIPVGKFQRMASVSDSRKKIAKFVMWLARNKLLLFSSVDLEKLSCRIKKISKPRTPTVWANYHKETKNSDRYRFILSAIKKYKIRTLLDMAGNAGFLAYLINENCNVEHVICFDYDENAIDDLYDNIKDKKTTIVPCLQDFRISIMDTNFKTAHERFKSDAVVALALTHHLILSQGLTLDFIMARLRCFSCKYVFVEFMPLGLYDSRIGTIPVVPSWYKIDWFREGFEKYFTLLEEKELDANRILLIGKIPS